MIRVKPGPEVLRKCDKPPPPQPDRAKGAAYNGEVILEIRPQGRGMRRADERDGGLISAAFDRLFAAIHAKDRSALERLHDPAFRGSDLEGRVLTVEDHVAGAMAAGELEMELFDLEVRRYGDFALSWGRQTLRAAGSKEWPTQFSFLIVWRLGENGWGMITYQLTELKAAGVAA